VWLKANKVTKGKKSKAAKFEKRITAILTQIVLLKKGKKIFVMILPGVQQKMNADGEAYRAHQNPTTCTRSTSTVLFYG